MNRLYVVTRADLPAGDQATQMGHALSAFAVEHPELHRAWHQGGSLIFLAAPDEAALDALKAHSTEIPSASFREPDIGNELTAIALGEEARRLCANLPLALRDYHPTK